MWFRSTRAKDIIIWSVDVKDVNCEVVDGKGGMAQSCGSFRQNEEWRWIILIQDMVNY